MYFNTSKLDPDERIRGMLRLYPIALAYLLYPPVFRMSAEARPRGSGDAKRSLEDWLSVKLEVEDMLDGLPHRERVAVTLYYLNGNRQREVAEALGVSQPRLSAILARARRRLVRRVSGGLKPDG